MKRILPARRRVSVGSACSRRRASAATRILGAALAHAMTMVALRAAEPFDLVIRNGTVYDGSGGPAQVTDVAVRDDRIAAIGTLNPAEATGARVTLDVTGLAVAPGFINMLSWAGESLLADGRSQSDIRQGVTLEIMGEGTSMGPLNDAMKRELTAQQGDLKYDVTWTTLGQFLEHLVARGVSCNVASFVGATAVRIHELGYANRAPTPVELLRMQTLVAQAMVSAQEADIDRRLAAHDEE